MNKIYFVVSSTPTVMGKFIRLVTGFTYNHISFATQKDLSDLRSFSRYYYEMPLYGGYVHECYEAYMRDNESSQVKIYEFEIDNYAYHSLVKVLDHMEKNANDFQYNLLNALFHPLGKQFHIHNCFTCEEFCAYILKITGLYSEFLTIREFCTKFESHCIYEGSLDDYEQSLPFSTTYQKNISKRVKIKITGQHFIKLLKKYKKSYEG